MIAIILDFFFKSTLGVWLPETKRVPEIRFRDINHETLNQSRPNTFCCGQKDGLRCVKYTLFILERRFRHTLPQRFRQSNLRNIRSENFDGQVFVTAPIGESPQPQRYIRRAFRLGTLC